MPRWAPDVRTRLEDAALDVFEAQGYQGATVGEVAARAGVTSRTFFRHFPDKREVLFGNEVLIRDRVVETLRGSPATPHPLAAVLRAMSALADLYHPDEHAYLERRDAVIAAATELQEREALKLASLAAAVAHELTARGCDPADAGLVADLALVVFRRAAGLWMTDPTVGFADLLRRAAADSRRALDDVGDL